jgi:hypothetical protein
MTIANGPPTTVPAATVPGANGPVDGRQSQAALAIARGTQRLLAAHGYTCLPEVTLSNGHRVDLLALGPRNEISVVEIKSSLDDFRVDHKWPEYLAYCDRFYFAVAPDFPKVVLPEAHGLIVADRYGAALLREPTPHPLNAARRKALIAHLARLACHRLHGDPEIGARDSIFDG